MSIVATKQNRSLAQLNERLINLELMEKAPIINDVLEEVYKEFYTLDNEVKNELLKMQKDIFSNQPILSIENKMHEYIICKSNKYELRYGMPYFDPDFMYINNMDDCQQKIKKLKLMNVTNNPAFGMRLFINNQLITYEFNLSPKESKDFIIAISELENLDFKIEYMLLNGIDRYSQEFSYIIKANNGMWRGNRMSLPQQIEM